LRWQCRPKQFLVLCSLRKPLTGQVGSYYERTLAADTAWSAPGVAEVHDLMTVD